LALIAAALWGFTPIGSKITLTGYSPEMVSLVRLGLSTWLFYRLGGPGTPFLPRERWSWVAGIALGLDFILYNYGVRMTRASLAGLVINVEVVTSVLLARVILGEALTARRIIGGVVTLVGATIVTAEGVSLDDVLAPETRLGNAIVMLAAFTWSLYAVAQRKAPATTSSYRLLAPIFGAALLTTSPLLLRPAAWHNPGGAGATGMLVVLALACTVGVYVVYARSQACLDLAVLSIVLAIIPVFAVGFAWLFLGEPVTPRVLAGGALILAGALVVAMEPAAPRGLSETARPEWST